MPPPPRARPSACVFFVLLPPHPPPVFPVFPAQARTQTGSNPSLALDLLGHHHPIAPCHIRSDQITKTSSLANFLFLTRLASPDIALRFVHRQSTNKQTYPSINTPQLFSNHTHHSLFYRLFSPTVLLTVLLLLKGLFRYLHPRLDFSTWSQLVGFVTHRVPRYSYKQLTQIP